jgi:protein arginine kinase
MKENTRENHPDAAPLLDRLSSSSPAWAEAGGPFASTILSSRVRLARNLASLPFPAGASPAEQRSVIDRLRRTMGSVPALADSVYVGCEDLPEGDLQLLVERRLVSRDLAAGSRRRGVLVGEGEELSIMINEEDHLRLQSLLSGLRLGEALDRVGDVDDALDGGLDFAFDEQLGFLTACPTNVGTGMRASVLAHLPALVLTRRARKVMQGVSAMGLAVRGYYGEGTEIMGNFFQISNQSTLGKGENEIVSRLDEVVRQIVGYEEEARATMWREARLQLEDKIYRAYGTLQNARSISAEEVVSLASAVRFGICLEMDGLCPLAVLNEILIVSQPGHVSHRAGRVLSQEERRQLRATAIRTLLGGAGEEPRGRQRGIAGTGPPPDPAAN